MKPDTRSHGGDLPEQPNAASPAVPQQPVNASNQEAAANVIRGQLGALYGDQPVAAAPQKIDDNPYHRTHRAHPLPEADQWKTYHSAWQTYYQKYYEQYYTQQKESPKTGYFSHSKEPEVQPESAEMDTDEALYDLRQKLLGKVQASAQTVRKSRHFIPIMASIIVVLLFVFVQYNRTFIATVQAYVAPGDSSIQNIVIDPAADVAVSPEPRLIIPKINVDVPVIYDVATDDRSQQAAMEKGVAHFPVPGANSKPGQIGNTVLSGHSSNDLFDSGIYKFIFAQLEKMQVGDTIYANYEGVRYTYVITRTEVVRPNEVNKLIYPTDKPILTLITCTPLGTALNRLLVTAEQVSPDLAQAIAAPAPGAAQADVPIPGNSPTFIERLFGRN
jgi:sortase A